MGIYVVADVHGAPDEVAKAVPEGATLLLLGDLVNFIDYTSMSGILTEVFSLETVDQVVRLRTAGQVDAAREVMRRRAEGREDEIAGEIRRRVAEQYRRVLARLPDPTYLVLGNVDNPEIARPLIEATPAVREVDGRAVTIAGDRVGFVGGGLPTALRVAGEIPQEKMKAKVDGLGEVDVVCSHVPPSVPELCFDTRARRCERGSDDLLRYIEDVQPRRAYFGHIHQPLVSCMHVGRTLCINVGYFRATRRAFPHDR